MQWPTQRQPINRVEREKRRHAKPRIRRSRMQRGAWTCFDVNHIGVGETPAAAYAGWKRQTEA